MKTLFLVWHRSGRPAHGPFKFQPYLYGPCAFDLYSALEDMKRRGLIAQAPHPISQRAPYFLTEAGRLATESTLALSDSERATVQRTARWAAWQHFQSLLEQVYREAPDYAVNSVARIGGTGEKKPLTDPHRSVNERDFVLRNSTGDEVISTNRLKPRYSAPSRSTRQAANKQVPARCKRAAIGAGARYSLVVETPPSIVEGSTSETQH